MSASRSPTPGPAPAIAFASGAGNLPSRVLICDETSQSQIVSDIVTASEAEPVLFDNIERAARQPAGYTIALIGFAEAPDATAPTLSALRVIADASIPVICYGECVQKWPLAKRCSVLAAGASAIFDSSRAAFSEELRQILTEILKLQNGRREEEKRVQAQLGPLGIIGESRPMRAIFRWIERAAALSDLPILITGETGTGKQLLVTAIHKLDPKRSWGPLVALNCAAITAGVAESELFGHRRGSFTGADRDRRGLIRSAEGGILFLDEIGDLDLTLQAKLLRVLQENRVLAVGEDRELPIDVRVVAATNRNLERMVAAGEFRDDLYHRLNILSVHIPPLRQRPADIEPLVKHFAEKYKTLSSGNAVVIGNDFLEAVRELELPGNARELENLVRRALIHRRSSIALSLADMPQEILGRLAEKSSLDSNETTPARQPDHLDGPDIDDCEVSLNRLLQLHHGKLAETLDHCERSLISLALKESKGNQSLAGRLLGITPRSIYNKLRKHHLRCLPFLCFTLTCASAAVSS